MAAARCRTTRRTYTAPARRTASRLAVAPGINRVELRHNSPSDAGSRRGSCSGRCLSDAGQQVRGGGRAAVRGGGRPPLPCGPTGSRAAAQGPGCPCRYRPPRRCEWTPRRASACGRRAPSTQGQQQQPSPPGATNRLAQSFSYTLPDARFAPFWEPSRHSVRHITSHHITSHHITSHHITSHHISLSLAGWG